MSDTDTGADTNNDWLDNCAANELHVVLLIVDDASGNHDAGCNNNWLDHRFGNELHALLLVVDDRPRTDSWCHNNRAGPDTWRDNDGFNDDAGDQLHIILLVVDADCNDDSGTRHDNSDAVRRFHARRDSRARPSRSWWKSEQHLGTDRNSHSTGRHR